MRKEEISVFKPLDKYGKPIFSNMGQEIVRVEGHHLDEGACWVTYKDSSGWMRTRLRSLGSIATQAIGLDME